MRAVVFMVLTCLAAAALPGAPAAQTAGDAAVELTLEQARALARQSLSAGNLAAAAALSDTLLDQNPEDAEMLVVRAILARSAGDTDSARAAAERAYRISNDPAVKFDAAVIMANILAREESYFAAELWVRRADQFSETEQQSEITRTLFQQVRRANPLTVELRFSIRPSNNVNNGAEELEIEIGGLPFLLDALGQQLSGIETSAGVSLRYRLSESRDQRTEFLGEFFFRDVRLSSESSELVPFARDSDFDYGVVILGLRRAELIWPDIGPTVISGVAGQSWYGGEALSRWVEFTARQTVVLDDFRALTFSGIARIDRRQDNPINDSEQYEIGVDYRQAIENAGSYGLGASFRAYESASGTVDRNVFEVTADRIFGRMGAIEPRMTLTYRRENYLKFFILPDGRREDSITLDVAVRFPDFSFYGFIPEATLRARSVGANVDIYDRNEYAFGVTMVSRF